MSALFATDLFFKGKTADMETLERNHKATARGKEQPESWVGRYKLLPSPLVGRWQTMCIDMETQEPKTFHKAVRGGESSNVTENGKSMCCNQWQEWKITKWLWVWVLFEIAAVGGLWAKKKKIEVRKLTLSSFAGVVNQNVRFNTLRAFARCWMKLNRDVTLRDQQCLLQILTFRFRR